MSYGGVSSGDHSRQKEETACCLRLRMVQGMFLLQGMEASWPRMPAGTRFLRALCVIEVKACPRGSGQEELAGGKVVEGLAQTFLVCVEEEGVDDPDTPS